MIKLSEDAAKAFYEIHKEKPFYGELVEYMTSGPCVPIALGKRKCSRRLQKTYWSN